MTAATRTDVPIALEGDGVVLRTQVIGGGFSVGYVTLPQGADMGPAFKGLPGDACQCPHWGYLLKGRLLMRTDEGDETYEAGQAYYWGPGHVPVALEDSELVEFSPTDDFRKVIDHLTSAVG
ncbi:hypothetical protein ACKI1I_39410 [Streptomyces turgidiscabies]|uniref:Cupin domain protein n=1 Tax=Streptomyces turgidiscabies (strain Car8) TaxID=698760 RepID=L7F475_STRT8|nr:MULTISPECIES: hypothetical protein [Streptomyces]ELP66408.1 hypothetical protein STRTUCAR8_04135 [Streptomyces turgidiscabies Car8]MDX3497604.1 hypothetical protein [Streptomyces turgidiscabies]GAQ76104.1 hypothetical protein T45_07893 [Streptomyces turgidiscabies]